MILADCDAGSQRKRGRNDIFAHPLGRQASSTFYVSTLPDNSQRPLCHESVLRKFARMQLAWLHVVPHTQRHHPHRPPPIGECGLASSVSSVVCARRHAASRSRRSSATSALAVSRIASA